jgi:hypothetical protein
MQIFKPKSQQLEIQRFNAEKEKWAKRMLRWNKWKQSQKQDKLCDKTESKI